MDRRHKPFIGVIAFFILIVFSYSCFASTYPQAAVLVNNNSVRWGTSPVQVDGTVYVPIKEISEALGMQGSFDTSTLAYSLKMDENTFDMKLDNSIANLNGKYVQMPGSMKVINNRVMAPVGFVQQLGMFVTQRSGKMLVFKPQNGYIVYKAVSGDYLWQISQMFGTSIATIKSLNNLTSDSIYVGQMLKVKIVAPFSTNFDAATGNATIKSGPGFGYSDVGYLASRTHVTVTGKNGLWYKASTPKGNGYIYYSVIKVTQQITDTTPASTYFQNEIPVDTSNNTVSYSSYKVVAGDTLWNVAEKWGIPVEELAAANRISVSSSLSINQILKVPVHTIALKQVPDLQSGEILDWYKEGQYVLPIGKKAKVTDLQTGLSFNVERTMGSSHSDTETVTAADSETMKTIFGGSWSWVSRPFILEVDGRRLAVSISGMPHAGVDGQEFLRNVDNRSGDYGYGPNYDMISGNGMDGHFDMYFLNGRRHADNQIDSKHQKAVIIAGGLK